MFLRRKPHKRSTAGVRMLLRPRRAHSGDDWDGPPAGQPTLWACSAGVFAVSSPPHFIMSKMHPLAKVATQSRQLLANQQISIEGPGTLLRDVQALIDFIGTRGVDTQSNRGNLPASLLPELNARLSDPLEIPLKRPLLRDYPNVAGVYVLLRVLDLVRADATRVWVDAERLAAWNDLNPTERYFALLETWLLDADGAVLGGASQHHVDGFAITLRFLTDTVSATWKTFDEYVHKYAIRDGGVSPWNVQLMVRLGLIEVVPRPVAERSPRCGVHGWMMWKARRTPWGEAVAWAVREQLVAQTQTEDDIELYWLQPPEGDAPGIFQPSFQPFFPEYQKVFALPPLEAHPGVYVFKVGFVSRYSPTDPWRRLAVPDKTSLYELATAVLKAFKFEDEEHMHEFRYRDRIGRERVYLHPRAEEGEFSDEISVGETDLPEKQTMKFLFDFGASWRFVLRLESIEPPDPKLKRPKVIASAGVSPKQYEGEGW